MKLRLDENLGTRAQKLFAAAGHDVQSVAAEGLSGAADPEVYQVSRREGRCLVTLDLDFADVTRFPPGQGPGIVVIRLPKNPTPALLALLLPLRGRGHQSRGGALAVAGGLVSAN